MLKEMIVKERLLRIGVLVLGLMTASTAAFAAPILIPTSPGIVGTIVILTSDPTDPLYDVRGIATAEAIETDTATDLGPAILLGGDPFPEDHLGLTDTAEALGFFFDFSTSNFVGTNWFVNATGIPLTALVNPAIASFLGSNTAQFSLLSDGNGTPLVVDDQIVGFTYTYGLDFIINNERAGQETPVPEPATLTMLGTGLLWAARRRRAA